MLERKLYQIILITAFSMSVISLTGNVIIGFPIQINIKWIVLISVSLVAFLIQRCNKGLEIDRKIFFIFMILFFLPFGYIDSGGSANNALGYEFLILISISYLFKGAWRLVLIGLHILVFMVMATIEYMRPEWIKVYSAHSQYIDRIVQIPLIMLVSFAIIKLFADAYDRHKEAQKKYSAELERANERLRYLANYDDLTGLYNRRAFNQRLDQLYIDHQIEDQAIHVVLIDLDAFKMINDTKGHIVGDAVLSNFGKVLLQALTPEHVVCRWGGDEFSVLFFGDVSALNAAIRVLQDNYRQIVQEYEVRSALSVGAVLWDPLSSPLEILIKADQALYASKADSSEKIIIL